MNFFEIFEMGKLWFNKKSFTHFVDVLATDFEILSLFFDVVNQGFSFIFTTVFQPTDSPPQVHTIHNAPQLFMKSFWSAWYRCTLFEFSLINTM